MALQLGLVLILACLVATLPWWAALRSVRTSGYFIGHVEAIFTAWWRRLGLAMAVAAVLVSLRPTMFACFWASWPFLRITANRVLAQPFEHPSPRIERVRGLYHIGNSRRCPHGVKLFVVKTARDVDYGPGFVYQPDAAECNRFRLGMPMGGGWYASE